MTLPILSIKQWFEKGIFNLSMSDGYSFIHFYIGSSIIISAGIRKSHGLRLQSLAPNPPPPFPNIFTLD